MKVRERVAALLAAGFTRKEVAAQLGVTRQRIEQCVNHDRHAVYGRERRRAIYGSVRRNRCSRCGSTEHNLQRCKETP